MQVLRARHMGMCFGVRDAIALAEAQAKLTPLTILGDLGAIFGRKKLSTTTISRASSTIGKASRAGRESQDVGRAKERVEAARRELADLQAELDREIGLLEDAFDPALEELDEIQIRPKASVVEVTMFGIVWRPMRKGASGQLVPDWSG